MEEMWGEPRSDSWPIPEQFGPVMLPPQPWTTPWFKQKQKDEDD